jgi:hypothetical protein
VVRGGEKKNDGRIMVVLPLFPYLFLLFFFSIFLASAAPSLLLQFLFFTSLVWSSLPFLSFSVFLCFCVLSSSVSLPSLFFFLFVSVSLFFLVYFCSFSRSLGLSLSLFLTLIVPLSFVSFLFFCFLFYSSLFSTLFLFFYPPFNPLFPMVFISGKRGREDYYPCLVMAQG